MMLVYSVFPNVSGEGKGPSRDMHTCMQMWEGSGESRRRALMQVRPDGDQTGTELEDN